MIFGTYGIHPHETINNKINSDKIIEEVNNNKTPNIISIIIADHTTSEI